MGAAKTSMLVLVLLGYGVFVGGVVLSNLPIASFIADPPLLELAVPTGVAIIAFLVIEAFVP